MVEASEGTAGKELLTRFAADKGVLYPQVGGGQNQVLIVNVFKRE
jgi:hypothetical protein